MVRGKNRAPVKRQGVLLVVGDANSALSLHDRQDFPVNRVADVAAALALAEPAAYSALLVDLISPEKCALGDLPELKRVYTQAKLLVLDGEGSIEAAVTAIKAGAWDYLYRPITPAALRAKVVQAQARDEESALRSGDPVVAYVGQHATAISSRAEVASRFGLSSDTVSSKVRAATGRTFMEYLHQCRLDQAQQLLATTELNVSQVAARVGFSTPQHFSRVFRKHTGLSPARYRLQERARRKQGKKN